MKKTKIVFTLGPASGTKDMISRLHEAGGDIARINMSHADQGAFLKMAKAVKEANRESTFPISILLDTQGTDIRLDRLLVPIPVETGEKFLLWHGTRPASKTKGAGINMNVFKNMRKGTRIFIDDGTVELEAVSVQKSRALCKVNTSGLVKSRKSVNIPSVEMGLGGINKKDYGDIRFAIKNGAEIVTLSFIRHSKEVAKVRKLVKSLNSHAKIIAKIEDAKGVDNIDEILEESDGIMVARGDLGTEIPLEEVPLVQKAIIEKCLERGKQVVVATHMMESMIDNPRPTRAEVSDVANAVAQKADMVMLSAETSIGKYPVRCVETMSRICRRMEREERFVLPARTKEKRPLKEEITISAALLARNADAKAIIVFTKSGELARLTAKYRPTTPIFAFTQYEGVRRELTLARGVYTYPLKLAERSHVNTANAVDRLKKDGFVKKGDMVVIISDIFKGHKKSQIIWARKVQ